MSTNKSAPGSGRKDDVVDTRHSIPDPQKKSTLPPRLRRLSLALLKQPHTIRDLEDVIPANNPAEYVRQLRSCYCLKVPCLRISSTTVDGAPSWYGCYHLTSYDREKLQRLIRDASRA